MTRAEEIEALRRAGSSDSNIAEQLGISKQRVAQIAGPRKTSEAVLIYCLENKNAKRALLEDARKRIFLDMEDLDQVISSLGLPKGAARVLRSSQRRNAYLRPMGLRYCPHCRRNRPLVEFRAKDGYCRKCQAERSRDRNAGANERIAG